MQNVYIVGVGATPVGEHYTRSLTDLALDALHAAFADTSPRLDPSRVGALYVANAMAEALAGDAHLGALLASAAGLTNVETLRVSSAGASGGAALHQGALAVASGAHDLVLVTGVEKVTDKLQNSQEASLSLAADSDFEAEHGITITALWAMLMRRYMHDYSYAAEDFAPFPVNAHANSINNPEAMYRFPIKASSYGKASQIASPLNMFDCATLADGAAVLLLASEGLARELESPAVRIAGRSLTTDTLALHDRADPLWLEASHRGAVEALRQAKVSPADVDVLELTDPHSIAAALALEACGFVERGTAPRHAAEGGISPEGTTPLATAGGYKARGDAGGASGVYQVVELTRQLRGDAPSAQVANARVAFAQCLGGVGATAVTHVLVRDDDKQG